MWSASIRSSVSFGLFLCVKMKKKGAQQSTQRQLLTKKKKRKRTVPKRTGPPTPILPSTHGLKEDQARPFCEREGGEWKETRMKWKRTQSSPKGNIRRCPRSVDVHHCGNTLKKKKRKEKGTGLAMPCQAMPRKPCERMMSCRVPSTLPIWLFCHQTLVLALLSHQLVSFCRAHHWCSLT